MKNLLVISGSDESAVKQRALAVIREWVGPEYESSNDLETVRGDDDAVAPDVSLRNFADAAATPPFFGGEKTVWLRHWSGFKVISDARSAKAGEALAKLFTDLILNPPEVPGVRLLVDGSGLDGRKALAKSLKNSETAELEMLNLPDTRARDYARQQALSVIGMAKSAGFKIAPDAAEYLAVACGGDRLRLSNELEKLYAFVGPEKSIRLADCRETVTCDAAAVSWELGTALSERNAPEALALVAPLVRQMKLERGSGNQELMLVWNVSGVFTDIVQTLGYMKELKVPTRFGPNFFDGLDESLKERFPHNKLLSVHPFRAYKLCESASRWSASSCAKALDLIAEAQRQMVSGGEPRLVLEKLILDLCRA